jgi:hypothetical protein
MRFLIRLSLAAGRYKTPFDMPLLSPAFTALFRPVPRPVYYSNPLSVFIVFYMDILGAFFQNMRSSVFGKGGTVDKPGETWLIGLLAVPGIMS